MSCCGGSCECGSSCRGAQCGEQSIDSLYGHDDIHGLDYWAKKRADYLSSEPPDGWRAQGRLLAGEPLI
uniref:Uncharacterized protein n=1 Tax=Triticum urartu TaxID=4572 RepID=A0A8R7PRE5_TRIUA